MYITNIGNSGSQIGCPICPLCPTVCKQQWSLSLSLLGAAFGLVSLALYYIRKKHFLHVRSKRNVFISRSLATLVWIFFGLFFLYFIQIDYLHTAGGCSIKGVLLRGGILPDIYHPLFIER